MVDVARREDALLDCISTLHHNRDAAIRDMRIIAFTEPSMADLMYLLELRLLG